MILEEDKLVAYIYSKKKIMHALKYFSDTKKESLFTQIESYLNTQNVTGMSISIEHNGDIVSGLLGYVPANDNNSQHRVIEKTVCNVHENLDKIQSSIDAIANEMGSFICQSCCVQNDTLSVVFLT